MSGVTMIVRVLAIGVLAFLLSAVSFGNARAQEFAVVISEAPIALVIDGLQADSGRTSVGPGAQVCVPAATTYSAVAERWVFQGWSKGAEGSNLCAIASTSGVYRARYSHEVLVSIASSLPEFRRADWVTVGAVVDVQVPLEVGGGPGVRYRFSRWSGGETPFSASNRIAALAPTVLEVTWSREYLLQVGGPEGADIPGSGWYAEGATVLLNAPELIALDSTRRRVFTKWKICRVPI